MSEAEREQPPDVELRELALERDRLKLERERLELAREKSRKGWSWGQAAPFLTVAVSAIAIFVTVLLTTRQISADRGLSRERARNEVRLAAISIVLGAPTCSSAKARALMADKVAGTHLAEVVDEVGNVAFAPLGYFITQSNYQQFTSGSGFLSKVALDEFLPATALGKLTPATRRAVEKQRRVDQAKVAKARREYRQELANAQKERDRLCKQLGG